MKNYDNKEHILYNIYIYLTKNEIFVCMYVMYVMYVWMYDVCMYVCM